MRTILISALLLTTAAVIGCGVSDPNPPTDPTVKTHFYPFQNGTVYTYSRFIDNKYDTIDCRLIIAQTPRDTTKLVIDKPLPSDANGILYYLGYTNDASGQFAATLTNDSARIYALAGSLETNTSWMADPVREITATVVEHYDEYWLPGRMVKFDDVLVIKYHQAGQPDNVYTLRFFAKGEGLIFERQMVGPNTEIGNLQLLKVTPSQSAGEAGNPVFHPDHRLPQSLKASLTSGK